MEQLAERWTGLRENFPTLLGWSGNLLSALIILVVGIMIGRWLSARMRRTNLGGHHLDATLRPVLASTLFYVILAMTIYAVLRRLGVDSTSLLAVFGGAALAIGLALRETLANIAAGVMLLFLRPLQVGDFVDIGSSQTMGTVEEIGLFTSTIRNMENIAVYVPNSSIWGNRVQNFGRHAIRKAIVEIGVGYDTDLDRAVEVLTEVLDGQPGLLPFDAAAASQPTIEGEPAPQTAPSPPEVYVMSFGDSAIILSCRCWLPSDTWLKRASDLRTDIKRALDREGIEIPFPQRVVHMRQG